MKKKMLAAIMAATMMTMTVTGCGDNRKSADDSADVGSTEAVAQAATSVSNAVDIINDNKR